MARRLKLQMQTTIDGFVAGQNGEMDWVSFLWTEDIKQYVTRLTESVDTIILGRKLAEGFIPHWAGVAADSGNPEQAAGEKFSATQKVVFTKTLGKSEWENTLLAKGNMADEVIKLKNQKGKDIIAYGGVSFASALVKQGLIDEYHLFVNQAAIGKGLSIFKELTERLNLTLIKALPFDCGIVVLHYEPDKN